MTHMFRFRKGNLPMNYVFLLVLGMIVLLVLVGFNFSIGDKIREIIDSILLPDM